MKRVRIGGGQGFWGDWLDAPVALVERGRIDYLVLDYLAEVTMSILAKQKERDPQSGYARDFVDTIGRLLPTLIAKNIKVISNAGGMNPRACAEAVLARAAAAGISSLRVAVVSGDDQLQRIGDLERAGESLANLDDGRSFSEIKRVIRSANVYLGSAPLVEALAAGAQIVITGRVADSALVLAPLRHELGWREHEHNLLAAGTIAGHVLECGAQASGGNYSYDWESVPDLAHIGYPIAEVLADGSFVVTKPEGTGGRVDLHGVTEQLVYEIGDPTAYRVPDVTADFTGLQLAQQAENEVQVTGARGTPPPEKLKMSISYFAGYTAYGTMVYTWPDAYRKAKRAGGIITQRLQDLQLPLDAVHTEIIGINACHGALTDLDIPEIPEVMLRVAVRGRDQAAVNRFTREVAPLVLSGPPSATGYAGGKRQVQEVVAYWPTLIARSLVQPKVELLGGR